MIFSAFLHVQLEGRGAAGDGDGRAAPPEPFLVSAARFGVAMLVLDAWQYFMHRLMHSVPCMYRRFHSWHHRVAAPYAYAAQYGHLVDGVLTETLSGAAAYLASGMPPRAAAAFFAFATVKGVDDHCGVAAPWNPDPGRVPEQRRLPRRAPPARRRAAQLLPALLRGLGPPARHARAVRPAPEGRRRARGQGLQAGSDALAGWRHARPAGPASFTV